MPTTATKERPIIMSADSVRAILAGKKTQTRRVVKPQPLSSGGGMWGVGSGELISHAEMMARCPYGHRGDRLWVKEACATYDKGRAVVYAADVDADSYDNLCPHLYVRRSPLFMPRWASRLTLEITAVRVERVQDISSTDIIHEGVTARSEGIDDDDRANMDEFARRWDALNAKRGFQWASNPWVWVLSFTKVD